MKPDMSLIIQSGGIIAMIFMAQLVKGKNISFYTFFVKLSSVRKLSMTVG
jgi:hypothetical protein